MNNRLTRYWVSINTGVILVGMILLGYFYFLDGTFTPEVNITSLSTTKTTYARGETVEMLIDFCKYRNVPVHFQWTLYDDDMPPITYKEKTSTGMPKGCYHGVVRSIEMIPKYVVPGVYHFENRVIYQINPVKTIEYVIKTNNFNIQ